MPDHDKPPGYRLRTDTGGILRYSYCTPDFILGTLMTEARPDGDWAKISSQNRWQGVIFAATPMPGSFRFPSPSPRRITGLTTWWSVQSRSALITQSLSSPGTGPMRVWFSRCGLEQRTERDGWIFVKAPSAYAAVRVVEGPIRWEEADGKSGAEAGDWLVCGTDSSPVIVEVARQRDFKDFDSFKKRVLASPLRYEGKELDYTSLAGEHLTFFADRREPPKINGRSVTLSPPQASLKSPFISAEWNGGTVILRKGNRQMTLDFETASPSRPQKP